MMRRHLYAAILIATASLAYAQYHYESSPEHPYGLPNPEAPAQLMDFAPLIGECNCKSVARNADQTWGDTIDMVWRFKYIMNGMGVQDETLKTDGKHSGSIRQFIADSARWFVHYYSSASPSPTLPAWEGTRNEEGKIILYRKQKAPNGMDGFYKITFSDMTEDGFNWAGEWVTPNESFSFPTWYIKCVRNKVDHFEVEKQKILAVAKNFSKAYMNADYKTMADTYTDDGKIFPNNNPIIEGKPAIKTQWILPEGTSVLHHEIQPEQIQIIGDHAYDYGYYVGETKNREGKVDSYRGKYVAVWHKVGTTWKMFLDIWNRAPSKKD